MIFTQNKFEEIFLLLKFFKNSPFLEDRLLFLNGLGTLVQCGISLKELTDDENDKKMISLRIKEIQNDINSYE